MQRAWVGETLSLLVIWQLFEQKSWPQTLCLRKHQSSPFWGSIWSPDHLNGGLILLWSDTDHCCQGEHLKSFFPNWGFAFDGRVFWWLYCWFFIYEEDVRNCGLSMFWFINLLQLIDSIYLFRQNPGILPRPKPPQNNSWRAWAAADSGDWTPSCWFGGKNPTSGFRNFLFLFFRKTEILVHFGFLNSFCHVFSHTDVSDFNVMMFHFQIVLEWEFSRGQTLSSGDFTLTVWEFSENSLKQMTATFQLTGIPRSRQTLWKTGKTGFPETCTLFSAKWF